MRDIFRFGQYIPFVRDTIFAHILFHEVGHHLDREMSSPGRGGETPAENRSKRLTFTFVRKKYWYLVPFLKPTLAVLKLLLAVRSRIT